MRALTLILSLAALPCVYGQLLDSIALFAAQEPRFVAKLDMRGSFVNNYKVRIMGVKLGFEHAGRFQYGIGYSFLFTPVERPQFIAGEGPRTLRLRLGYISPYVDYAFYQRGPWEVRLPVQFGFGGASTIYRGTNGRKQRYQRTALLIYEPAMTVQYRFLKYFGAGVGWGFRLVWQTGDKLGEGLNAPIYTFGLRVFFGELWRDLRPKED